MSIASVDEAYNKVKAVIESCVELRQLDATWDWATGVFKRYDMPADYQQILQKKAISKAIDLCLEDMIISNKRIKNGDI